jgi:hypothetical protein
MNYFYIFDYTLMDYSDGSNGPPYDQNDWQELYLPTFQSELVMIEDATYEAPAHHLVHVEQTGFDLPGWQYDENLTSTFTGLNKDWSPIAPIPCRFLIYRSNNITQLNQQSIRIYAQPIYTSTIVPPSEYTLLFEGMLENDDFMSINLYNLWISK